MSISGFAAQDWVYVADSMGRVGQGYYKNKNNPSETITVSEFEKRRAALTVSPKENEEQIINKFTAPATAQAGQDGSGSALTPWDNPVVGEQTLKDEVEVSSPKVEASQTKTVSAAVPVQNTQEQESGSERGGGKPPARGSHTEDDQDSPETGPSKVICSELVRQGLMSQRARDVCALYAARHLDEHFERGYHFWALPCVRLMRRSGTFTKVISFLTKHRTTEVVFRMGISLRRTLLGRVVCHLHDRFCAILGRFVQPADVRTLYQRS